jgi:TonB family protein
VALPDPLPLTTYDVSLQRNDRVYPGGAVVTEFALASNGQLAALFVDTTLTLSALDTALLSAIFRATADTAVPPFPQDVALDTAFFQLQLVVGERVDRLDAIWARARVPTYRLSSMPVPDSANPMPMYRSLARGTRASGVTRVQFSVTAAGTVSPGSVRAVEGFNARAFGAIVDAVRQWRFRPATIGDCPVAVIMRRDFDYSVR